MVARARSTGRPTERIANWVVASALLVLTIPLIILVAIAIKCDSDGPIFVQRRRVARGRQYVAFKFRTTLYGSRGGRPTRVGRFIRHMHLEDLPQLINVFRGEMSCINPRPDRPFFLD